MLSKPHNAGLLANNILLLCLVIILFFLNFYTKTIFYRPSSTHQWRQTDCLSITKNYYEEGMNFFNPKIHFQGPKDGKAVSECPLLNYSVAALWKVFGEHEFIYRLLEYIIYITTIFVLFNTIAKFYRSWLLAFIIVSVFLTSPLLTYYSLNFLADVPALSLGICCFCFFLSFYNTKRIGFFYAALICGTLAVLMKASALIGLSMLIFFSLIDIFRLNRFFRTETLFTSKLWPAVGIFFSAVLILVWYRFALAYNLNNTNNIFLLTVLPIWEMEEAQIIYNLKFLFNWHFPVFLNRPMFFLFLLLVMYVVARFNKLNTFFKYSFVIAALYFVFYLVFFFQVFSVHDYYLNNLMIFPVVTCLSFAHIVSSSVHFELNTRFLRIFLFVSLIFNGSHAAAIYRLRMIEDDKMVQWFPFVTEEEQNLAKYLFWDYGNSIKKIEEFTPVLREHGIRRSDIVLSVPDQSFDISLYFMDQKGYTISREHFTLDETVTDQFKHRKIQYMILSDTTLKLQNAYKRIEPHLEFFFTEGGVNVYKFKSSFR